MWKRQTQRWDLDRRRGRPTPLKLAVWLLLFALLLAVVYLMLERSAVPPQDPSSIPLPLPPPGG